MIGSVRKHVHNAPLDANKETSQAVGQRFDVSVYRIGDAPPIEKSQRPSVLCGERALHEQDSDTWPFLLIREETTDIPLVNRNLVRAYRLLTKWSSLTQSSSKHLACSVESNPLGTLKKYLNFYLYVNHMLVSALRALSQRDPEAVPRQNSIWTNSVVFSVT